MKMKNLIYFMVIIMTVSILSSCATIVGGSNYYAKVQVLNHPKAKISYQSSVKGTGEANFKVKRSQANNFYVTIEEDGCEQKSYGFTQRTFRYTACVGSALGFTGFVPPHCKSQCT